jgi:magnesium chelatase family protein
VPAVEWKELTEVADGETSSDIRSRVNKARQIQLGRFSKSSIFCNAQMKSHLIKKHCQLDASSLKHLEKAVDQLGLSARAYHRVLKIARTIADLDGSEKILNHHVSEAIQYRTLDRRYGSNND